MLKKIKIRRNYLILISIYFIIHLSNLTLLPIFNDESIYLDWAWRFTHIPGHLYDSLLDSKQPLMIWLFAISENLFSDPLFAGRIVSVVIGAISLIGIYKISLKLFSKNTAFIAALLFSFTPIFVFFNRQALMESLIICVGIWSFNALFNLLHNPTIKNGLVLGAILGVGFLTKTSSLLYVFSSIIVLSFYIFKHQKEKTKIIKSFTLSLVSFFSINLILFINPIFYQTFSSNDRYSLSLSEIISFPIDTWFQNLAGFFEISFIYLTPFVFVSSIVGTFLLLKHKAKKTSIFLLFFFLSLIIEIILVKGQSTRYLVPFLPFLIIPASYNFSLLWKDKIWKKLLVILFLFFPFVMTLSLIINPHFYIDQTSKFTSYSEDSYINGQTSGTGINDVMDYIKKNSDPNIPTLIFIGLNAGNPESAVDIYSLKEENLYTFFIDASFFPNLDQYNCFTSEYPTFFITRFDQRKGLDRFFTLAKAFPENHQSDDYYIGAYTLERDCLGESLSLSEFYSNQLYRLHSLKTIF